MVEILVVIIIIGILAAIAIPIFLNQRKAARDSALASDTRGVALAYQTWRAQDPNANDDAAFEKLSDNRLAVIFTHPEGQWTTSVPNWNENMDLPASTMSQGSVIVLSIPRRPSHPDHVEGQFCLISTSIYSNYNYKHGSGNQANYDQQLYYDSELGGLKTVDELVSAYNNAEDTTSNPCWKYAEGYKKARGL